MKEIKYILHAFLLLLAFISVVICLKAFYSQKHVPDMVLTNQQKAEPNAFSKGKSLFLSKCASCHILGRSFTGPDLCGFESRGPWSERENVYQWIKNPPEFMKKDPYARELKESVGGVMMTAFPELTDADIDEIINFINEACQPAMAKY